MNVFAWHVEFRKIGRPVARRHPLVCWSTDFFPGEYDVLTEHEVARSWTSLFKNVPICDELLQRAEDLLVELRPESPLWHRLSAELAELRHKHTQPVVPPTRRRRKPVIAT